MYGNVHLYGYVFILSNHCHTYTYFYNSKKAVHQTAGENETSYPSVNRTVACFTQLLNISSSILWVTYESDSYFDISKTYKVSLCTTKITAFSNMYAYNNLHVLVNTI
mgnify:FL=1